MVLSSSLRIAESHLPVLLVFTPSTSNGVVGIDQLLEKARSVLSTTVQVMRVSDATHPEVSRSFGFATLPALVLVQRGLEVWRYAGPVDGSELVGQLSNQIAQTFPMHLSRPSV